MPKFTVLGVERDTGAETALEMESASPTTAWEKAQLRGLLPTTVLDEHNTQVYNRFGCTRWDYRVLPFEAHAKAGAHLMREAAKQFDELLMEGEADGFQYYRMEHYTLIEQPGCLLGLFGIKPTIITYDVAVFRRALWR